MNLLEIQHVTKTFQTTKALNDFSLNIPKGELMGLLGPNGAGKTTLIRIITQILGPDEGKVLFEGKPLGKGHIRRIGYMPEERGLYKKMKVGEQLMYLSRLKGLSKRESRDRINDWFRRFQIEDWWNKKVEELSKGMQQKIQFIATVVHEPDLLIFDEPFSGLDPINTNLIKKEIFSLAEKGKTILFSTHRMEQVEEICRYITLISKGNKVLDGELESIRQSHKKNQFRITYAGSVPEMGEVFSEFDRLDEGPGYLLFQLRETQNPNELLRTLLNRGLEIHGITELLPSLNDIFISEVAGSDSLVEA